MGGCASKDGDKTVAENEGCVDFFFHLMIIGLMTVGDDG